MAEFVFNELGLTKAATIHDGSAYAEALTGVFADEFTALGGEIVAQEAVQKGQTDMKPVLTAVAAAGPEVIYYPIFTAEGGFMTAQSKEVAGLEDVVLLGSDGMFSADFVKAAGQAALGLYLSSPNFSAFQEGYQDLLDKYKAKFGINPPQAFHAHGYDAANILLSAIEKVAVEGEDGTLYVPKGALRDAIYATKDFPGVTGILSCCADGRLRCPAHRRVPDRRARGHRGPVAARGAHLASMPARSRRQQHRRAGRDAARLAGTRPDLDPAGRPQGRMMTRP